jgi:hypothetical protein
VAQPSQGSSGIQIISYHWLDNACGVSQPISFDIGIPSDFFGVSIRKATIRNVFLFAVKV